MSIQEYPCADCEDCIQIGGGEGLCDYPDRSKNEQPYSLFTLRLIKLFEINENCPKPTKKGGKS